MTNNFINIRLGNKKKDDSVTVEQSLIETTANIVGTSYKGKAFVPQKLFAGQTIGGADVYNTLNNTLGNYRENQIAHLYDDFSCYVDSMAYDAASMWLNNGGIYSSFTRILGIGTGVADSQSGKMIGSGFNVSNNISSGTISQTRSNNLNAISGGKAGNTSFFLQKASEKSVSTTTTYADPVNVGYLNELGYYKDASNTDQNNITLNTSFLTDVILFASGVLPSLINTEPNNADQTNYTTIASDYTNQVKTIAGSDDCFISLLGFTPKYEDQVKNIIKLKDRGNNYLEKSTDYNSTDKNKFSSRLLEKGHFVYASYPFNGLSNIDDKDVFLLTTKPYSSFNNPSFPDYNSFESEFTTAKTPWVTSQPFNRKDINDNRMKIHENVIDLFRFYSLDDGDVGNKYRIKINPVLRGTQDLSKKAKPEDFATFDIYIFEYNAKNNRYTEREFYQDVNLDPESDNYIGFQIGTINKYYDFKSHQVLEKGLYENKSQYLRVEIHEDIEYKTIQNQHEIIPSGFRSYPHIDIKKNPYEDWYGNGIDTIFSDGVYQLPPMYALNYYEEYDVDELLIPTIPNNWGVVFNQSKFENNEQVREYDAIQSSEESPHFYYTKYFLNGVEQNFKNIWVEEDNYLNSFFHIEKIAIKKQADGSFSTYNNENKKNILYKHSGRSFESDYTYLNLNSDDIWEEERQLKINFENKLSFDFFTYGGFDGVDIRDNDKRNMRNDAIIRELHDSNEVKSTYNAYNKAIDIAMNDANCAGDIFVVPGIREIPIIEKCVQKCEEDRRHFYIADIGGSVSKRLVDYNDLSDNSIVVKNSLGLMGRYYFVDNTISENANLQFNFNNLKAIDERFLLGENNQGANVYYNYTKVLKDQYASTISNWKGLDIRSRYLLPVFGDISVSDNVNGGQITFQKQIASESFVLAQIAQLGSPRQSLTQSSILPSYSLEFTDCSFRLIDNENLSDNQLNFNLSTKDLRQGAINILHMPSNDNIKLLSENTAYDVRKSVFQRQSIVRTIQEIKKRIKFDIFTNDSYVNGGFLFSQHSNLNSLYTKLEIQLNFIMDSFLNAGYISNYILRIPKASDDKAILDMQNYIIRGSIILQFDQSDTIELTLNNILNDLSLLSDPGQEEVLVPIV